MKNKNLSLAKIIIAATLFSLPVAVLGVSIALYARNSEVNESNREDKKDSNQINKLIEELDSLNKQIEQLKNSNNTTIQDLETKLKELNDQKKELENLIQNSNLKVTDLSNYQIVVKSKEEFNSFLNSSSLDNNLDPIKNLLKLDERKLLQDINYFVQYRNLSTLLKLRSNLTIDIKSLEFYNWDYDNQDNIKNVESINNIKPELNGKYLKKSISFKIIDGTERDLEQNSKTISIGFLLSPSSEEVSNSLQEIKEEFINDNTSTDITYLSDEQVFNKTIATSDYDKTLLLINSNNSKELFEYIFSSNIQKDKVLSSGLDIEYKIYKLSKDSKQEINNISLNDSYNLNGYQIEFKFNKTDIQDKNKLIYTDTWKVNIELDTELDNLYDINTSIFKSRIDNFRKQINITKEDTENEETLKQKPIIVSRTAVDILKEIIGLNPIKDEKWNMKDSQVPNAFKYIFGDFNTSELLTVTAKASSAIDVGSLNSDKGLLKSALGINNYLNMINDDTLKNNLKVSINVSEASTKNVFSTSYTTNPSGRIEINLSTDDKKIEEKIAIYFASSKTSEYYSAGPYRFMSDLFNGADQNKANYNSFSNTLSIKSSRAFFDQYVQSLNDITSGTSGATSSNDNDIFRHQKMIDILKKAVGGNNIMPKLENYGPRFRFYRTVKKDVNINEIIKNKTSNKYEIYLQASTNNAADTSLNNIYVNLIWEII